MRFLYYHVKGLHKRIVAVLLLVFFGQVSFLLEPIVLRYSIDHWILNPSQFTSTECAYRLVSIALLLISLFTISKLFKIFEEYQTNIIAFSLANKIYTLGLKHALSLPFSHHYNQRIGSTVEKLQKAKVDIVQVVQIVLGTIVATILTFLFVVAYTISVNWIVALFLGIGFPLVAVIITALHTRIKELQIQILSQKEVLASDTVESLRNIEIVKSLGLVEREIDRLNWSTEKLVLLELKYIKRLRFYSFAHGSVLNAARVVAFAWMLYLVFLREITFGQFLSLYIYAFTLLLTFKRLGQSLTTLSEVNNSLGEFSKFLQIPIESNNTDRLRLGAIGIVELREVDFLYDQHLALSKISCVVNKGETIAFVGPSGSGKSTLSKILMGLNEPVGGQLLINGIDSKALNFDEVRKQVCVVPQEAKLFYGTIRENLKFYTPSATDEECITALKESGSFDYFKNSKIDLDTLVGESGLTLSVGERQRIAIARALIRKPLLLIFDEATSSLDLNSERELIRTIRELPETSLRLTILISHRLSSVMHADRIYVMENGRIVEEGNHNKLLMMKGLYHSMWRLQVNSSDYVPFKTLPLKLVG